MYSIQTFCGRSPGYGGVTESGGEFKVTEYNRHILNLDLNLDLNLALSPIKNIRKDKIKIKIEIRIKKRPLGSYVCSDNVPASSFMRMVRGSVGVL